MHTDYPCYACGHVGPVEQYLARVKVELLRMRWSWYGLT